MISKNQIITMIHNIGGMNEVKCEWEKREREREREVGEWRVASIDH